MRKTIHINNAEIVANKVIWHLMIDGNKEEISYSFSEKVFPYVVTERVDSVLMGLMIFIIRFGYDFRSDVPISRSLYYNLTQHFLSAICGEKIDIPTIIAPLASDLDKTGKIVSTGVSCGVDSLYTIATHLNTAAGSDFNLTDLTFLDAGSHHDKFERNTKEGRRNNCISFADSVGLDVLEVQTNLPSIFDKYGDGYSHVESHTYMTISCILAIQKGISKYYYSSGHSYREFDCKYKPTGDYDSSSYDLLLLNVASYAGHKFYSTGGDKSRLEKIKAIADFAPGWNHLNVCVNTPENDNTCFKCRRTILELDAIGVLDRFKEVFDVHFFRSSRRHYLQEMYIEALKGDEFMIELLPYYKKELSTPLKVRALFHKFKSVIRNRIIARL